MVCSMRFIGVATNNPLDSYTALADYILPLMDQKSIEGFNERGASGTYILSWALESVEKVYLRWGLLLGILSIGPVLHNLHLHVHMTFHRACGVAFSGLGVVAPVVRSNEAPSPSISA